MSLSLSQVNHSNYEFDDHSYGFGLSGRAQLGRAIALIDLVSQVTLGLFKILAQLFCLSSRTEGEPGILSQVTKLTTLVLADIVGIVVPDVARLARRYFTVSPPSTTVSPPYTIESLPDDAISEVIRWLPVNDAISFMDTSRDFRESMQGLADTFIRAMIEREAELPYFLREMLEGYCSDLAIPVFKKILIRMDGYMKGLYLGYNNRTSANAFINTLITNYLKYCCNIFYHTIYPQSSHSFTSITEYEKWELQLNQQPYRSFPGGLTFNHRKMVEIPRAIAHCRIFGTLIFQGKRLRRISNKLAISDDEREQSRHTNRPHRLQQVTALTMGNSMLREFPSIVDFTSVRTLYLYNNPLGRRMPSGIDKLRLLETVYLQRSPLLRAQQEVIGSLTTNRVTILSGN